MSIIHNKDSSVFMIDNDYQINKVTLEIPEAEHTHDFVELVYTTSGKGTHIINDKEFYVKRGDMLVINYSCRHTVIPSERLSYVDIMLKPEYFEKSLCGKDDIFLMLGLSDFSELASNVIRDNIFLHFDADELHRTETLLEWTWDEQNGNRAASAIVLKSALSLILSLVFRKMSQNQNLHPCINEALLSYISRNYCNKLSISDLASACGYSTEHFSRLFKNHTGQTPTEFICDKRLENARRLLLSTDKRIEEIITNCGFSDRSAFFRNFSKKFGISPLKLRKNQN